MMVPRAQLMIAEEEADMRVQNHLMGEIFKVKELINLRIQQLADCNGEEKEKDSIREGLKQLASRNANLDGRLDLYFKMRQDKYK